MTDLPGNSSPRSSTRHDGKSSKGNRLAWFLACALLLIAAGGCERSQSGRHPGFLHLRLTSNPTTLDPALITDVMGGGIAAKLFNGLIRYNENLEIEPDVARSWTLSADQLTYTFRLRNDVRFSNGRKVTARDVRYSFERVLKPGTRAPLTWVLDKIEGARAFSEGREKSITGIRVPDDRTIVLKLEKPFGPFLSLLAMTTAYIVPGEEVARQGQDFGTHPVGSGPYILSEWKHGQYLVLTARNDYFDGKPNVEGIYYRVIPEDLTAVMEFETGNLDVLQIPSSEYRRYTSDPAWKHLVHGMPGLNTYFLGLNCTRPPFDDVRVRRAVNMAIDRKRILNTIFEKRGLLASGPIPPGLWKETQKSDSEGYAYDPEKAKALLRQAGAAGATVRIFITADPEVLDIVEVIQYYLHSLGMKAEITQLDWSAFKQAVNKGEADAFWLSWWADYPDPENFLLPLFHSASAGSGGNRTRCFDRKLDQLIETAQRTVNEKERYRLYREAEDRVVKNAPWVFMWHRGDYYVVQPWVGNFKIYPIYSIEKKVDVTLKR